MRFNFILGNGLASWLLPPHLDMSISIHFIISSLKQSKFYGNSIIIDKFIATELMLMLLFLFGFQDVWAVSNSLLLWVHGVIQCDARNSLWHCGLHRNQCVCPQDILYCEDRLSATAYVTFYSVCGNFYCEDRLWERTDEETQILYVRGTRFQVNGYQ